MQILGVIIDNRIRNKYIRGSLGIIKYIADKYQIIYERIGQDDL